MMFNLPPDLQFLNRLLGGLHPVITRAALLRIALWCFVFLCLFHIFMPAIPPHLPYQNMMQEQVITPLATSTNDLRWSRLDTTTLPPNSLLWVSGSSHAIYQTGGDGFSFLPSLVTAHLPNPPKNFLNLKMATRAMDNYTAVLDGIARQPSAMVVVLNPFWVLNEQALFFKTNLMNRGVDYWANVHDWPLIPLTVSPGNMLWSFVGRHYAPTAQAYDILKHLKQHGAAPTQRKPKSKSDFTKKSRISYNQSAMFWIINRNLKGEEITRFNTNDWQATVMGLNNPAHHKWSEHLLRRTFTAISNSNIPTLVYVAPLNPAFEQLATDKNYQQVINRISQIATEHTSSNLRVITHIPRNIVRSITFKDYMHISDAGQFDDYLAKQITPLLQTGEE